MGAGIGANGDPVAAAGYGYCVRRNEQHEEGEMTCPYCNGTGLQQVEPRSSLSYRCPDCLEPEEENEHRPSYDDWADDQDWRDE